MKNNKKRGSAVALALLLGAGLLILGIVYVKLIRHSSLPTYQIDERVKVKYLADGLAEFALLKFQCFPYDYYTVLEYSDLATAPLNLFVTDNGKFQLGGLNLAEGAPQWDDLPRSSFDNGPVSIVVDTINLYTSNTKWDTDVLEVVMDATFFSRREKKNVTSRLSKTFRIQRVSLHEIPSP
ncbi:MAG: hypothetical protein GX221_07450 [Candidatus Riflebacteria bacterium]|nr:hypothetical protein [Candidatus Riflebacteria bacterium]